MKKSRLILIILVVLAVIGGSSGFVIGYLEIKSIENFLSQENQLSENLSFKSGKLETSFGFMTSEVKLIDSRVILKEKSFLIPEILFQVDNDRLTAQIDEGEFPVDEKNRVKVTKLKLEGSLLALLNPGEEGAETQLTADRIVVTEERGSLTLDQPNIQVTKKDHDLWDNLILDIPKFSLSMRERGETYEVIWNNFSLEQANQTQAGERINMTLNVSAEDTGIKFTESGKDHNGQLNNFQFDLDITVNGNRSTNLSHVFSQIGENFLVQDFYTQWKPEVKELALRLDNFSVKGPQLLGSLGKLDLQNSLVMDSPDTLKNTGSFSLEGLEVLTEKGELKIKKADFDQVMISSPEKWSHSLESFYETLFQFRNEIHVKLEEVYFQDLIEGKTYSFPSEDFTFTLDSKQGMFSYLFDNKLQITQIGVQGIPTGINPLYHAIRAEGKNFSLEKMKDLSLEFMRDEEPRPSVINQSIIGFFNHFPEIGLNTKLQLEKGIEITLESNVVIKNPLPDSFDIPPYLNNSEGDPMEYYNAITDLFSKYGLSAMEIRVDKFKALLTILDEDMGGLAGLIYESFLSPYFKEEGDNILLKVEIKQGELHLNGIPFDPEIIDGFL